MFKKFQKTIDIDKHPIVSVTAVSFLAVPYQIARDRYGGRSDSSFQFVCSLHPWFQYFSDSVPTGPPRAASLPLDLRDCDGASGRALRNVNPLAG